MTTTTLARSLLPCPRTLLPSYPPILVPPALASLLPSYPLTVISSCSCKLPLHILCKQQQFYPPYHILFLDLLSLSLSLIFCPGPGPCPFADWWTTSAPPPVSPSSWRSASWAPSISTPSRASTEITPRKYSNYCAKTPRVGLPYC